MSKETYSVKRPTKQNEMGNLVEIKMVVTRGKAMMLMRVLRHAIEHGDSLAQDVHGSLKLNAEKANIEIE
jgi:hypothetical protein